MVTRLYSHPVYLEHLTPSGHPERPDRLRAIERVLEDEKFAELDRVQAPEGDPAAILLVHPASYVEHIRSAIPEEGITSVDADTSVSPRSWQAALTAIGAANAAVDDVFSGRANNVFVASRPPGHHAEKTMAMGFCLFNNAAIAARYAQEAHGAERVAVVDWDVHHGNGTQDIFRSTDEVLFASIHQSPLYPGTGSVHEIGTGPGTGFTVNLPVPEASGDAVFVSLVSHVVVPLARAYRPGLILLSAGYDAHAEDPLAGCEVTDAGYRAMAATMRGVADELGVPMGVVLEGGYDIGVLARGVIATLEQVGKETPDAPAEPAEHPLARAAKERLASYWPTLAP